MTFSSLPLRMNSTRMLRDWFDALRAAGVILENKFAAAVGAGASLAEATFTIENNKPTPQNITGLVVSNLYRVTRIKFWIWRQATDTVMEAGEITVMFDGTSFVFGKSSFESAIACGVTLDINSVTGQGTYVSSSMAGTYNPNSKIGYTVTTQGTI